MERKKINLKKQESCRNIHEIRRCIDLIDHEIISLLSLRLKYVLAATKFKKNIPEIIAIERKELMIKKRKEWAKKNKLNQKVIEKIYSILLPYFTKEQLLKWKMKYKNTQKVNKF